MEGVVKHTGLTKDIAILEYILQTQRRELFAENDQLGWRARMILQFHREDTQDVVMTHGRQTQDLLLEMFELLPPLAGPVIGRIKDNDVQLEGKGDVDVVADRIGRVHRSKAG